MERRNTNAEKSRSRSSRPERIKACGDSLDLVLSSNYDHHCQWLVDKFNVIRQPGSYSRTHHSICSEENDAMMEKKVPPLIYQEKYRNCTNHVSNALGSLHLPSTQRGYGRKAN